MNSLFKIMFTIVPILVVCIFFFTFSMIFSPKLRSKMLKKQMKTLQYMVEDSEDIMSNLTKSTLNIQKNILTENKEALKEIATTNANIRKEGIKITSKAIKEGLTNELIYCKHCSALIESDSKFCKHCGGEQ